MKTEKRKADELVHDLMIYPRKSVSAVNVLKICDAVRSGIEMPLIEIEASTGRIIDGIHRWTAYRKLFGEDVELEVVPLQFKDEKDVFLAAVAANSGHGLPYSSFEITALITEAERRGIRAVDLASAIKVPIEKIEKILLCKTGYKRDLGPPVKAPYTSPEYCPSDGLSREPLKGSMRRFAGRELSKEQIQINRSAGGMRPLYYANEVIKLLKADAFDLENDETVSLLGELKQEIESRISARLLGV